MGNIDDSVGGHQGSQRLIRLATKAHRAGNHSWISVTMNMYKTRQDITSHAINQVYTDFSTMQAVQNDIPFKVTLDISVSPIESQSIGNLTGSAYEMYTLNRTDQLQPSKLVLACVQEIFVFTMCWFETILVHHVLDNNANSKQTGTNPIWS